MRGVLVQPPLPRPRIAVVEVVLDRGACKRHDYIHAKTPSRSLASGGSALLLGTRRAWGAGEVHTRRSQDPTVHTRYRCVPPVQVRGARKVCVV